MKEFKSIVVDNNRDATWGTQFEVPEDVVEFFSINSVSRFICNVNDLIEYPCAFISSTGSKFININKQVCKKLNLSIGSEVSVLLKEDKSEYGMPVPEEVVELFASDDEFYKYFHELTPGKQRSLLHMVGKLKGEEPRVKKTIVICNHLKRNAGKLDFKILNQDFKDYNESLKR